MKIGLIAAMPEEFKHIEVHFHPHTWERITLSSRSLEVLHLTLPNLELDASSCGVGKVNAAAVTTQLILAFSLDFILNFGVGGGFHPSQQVLDYVVADSFVYADVDLCNLGFTFGQLLGESAVFLADSSFLAIAKSVEPELRHRVHYGRFGSLDQFVRRSKPQVIAEIQSALPDVICVEMESTAIAHVCAKFGVPVMAVRVVSDVAIADVDETKVFTETLSEGARLVAEFVAKIVGAIESKQN
jgi:adenosylhomocysteine nucleosidase